MKKSTVIKIVIGIPVAAGIFAGSYFGSAAITGAVRDKKAKNASNEIMKRVEGFEDYFHQTSSGRCVYLPIKKNEPIAVIISGFDEKEVDAVCSALNCLDEISTTINYRIMFEDTNKYDQKIYINKVDSLPGEWVLASTLGITEYKHNIKYGAISYPVNMRISAVASKYDDYVKLTRVVKHELLHTLGFIDLSISKDMGESIMYGYMNYQTLDYSDADITRIKAVYDADTQSESSVQVNDNHFDNTKLDAYIKEEEEFGL